MFIFPVTILTPASVKRSIRQNTTSGGVAISGDEDVVITDGGGRWEIEYTGIDLNDSRAARVWEAWLDYLANGATACLVPLLSFATSPRASVKGAKPPSRLYVDDAEWPTEMRYALAEHSAEFAADAALRATTITLTTTKGPEPKGGEIFQVGSERAYRLIRPSGGDFLISPPLRAAASLGDPVIFDFPMVQAKLDPGSDFSTPLLRSQFGSGSLQFVETFDED